MLERAFGLVRGLLPRKQPYIGCRSNTELDELLSIKDVRPVKSSNVRRKVG